MMAKGPGQRRSAVVEGPDSRRSVDEFDYAAAAEVFITAGGFSRGAPMTYRRFPTAAAAIRFAIEEVPPTLLIRATMEVSESRFDHQAIQALYNHDAYPLARRPAGQKKPTRDETLKTDRRTSIGTV
jgi:hypothetical protein